MILWAEPGAPVGGAYLLGAEVRVALSHLAWTPLDDRVAEHGDDHDEQEVAGVHQVQVDEGAVVLRGRKQVGSYSAQQNQNQRGRRRLTSGTMTVSLGLRAW